MTMADISSPDGSRGSSSVSMGPSYPFAASPDIIRANQKDTYIISTLQTDLVDILRRLYGSRFTHTYLPETQTLTSLLYFALTTFIGNRTLGEEYTNIHQVDTSAASRGSQRLPGIRQRAGYILLSILAPYAISKSLPKLRARLRTQLETNLAKASGQNTASHRIQSYLLTHLSSLTSTAPIQALTLTLFYFSGSYYHLSKRILGLRYIFSKQLSKSEQQQRDGYEVLGVLLVLQMVVQGVLHVRSTIQTETPTEGSSAPLDSGASQPKNANSMPTTAADSRSRIASLTHTPLPPTNEASEAAHYDLGDDSVMAWLQPKQQRKCTLCLEPMKDPSATTCGHVFCWTCILDWVREKPECPLCRQEVLGQHVLPLRG